MQDDTKTSWPLKPLSEVVDLNPRLDKSGYRDDLNVSFVPMAAVEAGSGRIEVSQTKHFAAVKKGYTPFREGDVLCAKITPCMENGKMAVVPKLKNGVGFGSTEFHVLRPRSGIEPRYVYHFISNLSFRREAAHHMTGAVGQKRVPTSFLEDASIPVPPFDEQQLLVAEIEKQFSRLDEAVTNLKRVKANLKRYKAAVLKAAVEGKLTEDWRKQHPNVEPASNLLERILAERRVKWSGRGKYKEPAQPETNIIGPLPDPWILVSIDQLSPLVTDGDHKPPKRVPEGVPHLTAKHIKGWRISFEDCSYISLLDYERTRSRFEPQPGDFIVTCVGTVGQTAIVPAGITFSADRNLAGIRLVECGMTPKFLQIVLNSPDWQLRMRQASGSTAQPHLYLGDLRTLPIPLPPLLEQETIIEEVERRLSVIEKLEAAVQANLTRADRLRQAILKRAFEGKLITTKQPQRSDSLGELSLAAESSSSYGVTR